MSSGQNLGGAPRAQTLSQALYSASTNTVAASSIMQVTRGQCGGSHLLTTGCHAKVLVDRDHSGPRPRSHHGSEGKVWLAVSAVAGSGEGNPGVSRQPRERVPGDPMPTLSTPPPQLPGRKHLSACLSCHRCMPSTEPWPGREQLNHGHSKGWGW